MTDTPTLDELDILIQIDIGNLDKECEEYPDMLKIVGDAAASGVSCRDYSKAELDRVYSSLFVGFKSGGSSDRMAEAETKSSEQYRTAYANYLEFKLKADRLLGRKEAMGRKAFMLELLAKLYLTEHFSDVAIRDFQNKVKGIVGEKKKEKIADGRQSFNTISRRKG